jgi:hypothetical protein
MQGEIKLKLPFPRVEFDRYKRRLLPGTYAGYTGKWMQQTDGKVFIDRENSRANWGRLIKITSKLKKDRIPYSVRMFNLWNTGSIAVIRYGRVKVR